MPMQRIAFFGPLPGTGADARAKLERLRGLLAKASVDAALADDAMLEMWEKFVGLATLAAMTCLMRANVGEIVSTEEGSRLMAETLDACTRTAIANGYRPREATMAGLRGILLDPASKGLASMARDLDAGRRTEGRHVVADMLRRARVAGVDPGPLRAAWCHLESHEIARQRAAAPR